MGNNIKTSTCPLCGKETDVQHDCSDGEIYEHISKRDCSKEVNDKIDEVIANISKELEQETSDGHKIFNVIYLENGDANDDRLWCQNKVWDDEDCTKYVRADKMEDDIVVLLDAIRKLTPEKFLEFKAGRLKIEVKDF